MPSQNDIQEDRAMQIAWKHEEKFNPVNVTNSKSKEDNGIDIRSDRRTIEVKGGRDKRQFIPDAHGSEFDRKKNLIADYLYLVRFEDGKEVGFYTLSREEVGQYRQKHRRIEKVRFASRLGTDLRNGKFPNRLRGRP